MPLAAGPALYAVEGNRPESVILGVEFNNTPGLIPKLRELRIPLCKKKNPA